MFGEILWTSESEAHIARHGISPEEVEEALYTRRRWVDTGREDTRLVWCTTTAGRHLLVVVSDAADGRDFVVTAREMDKDEKSRFRRKGN